jgi:copper chaperone CopZ
MTQRIMIESMSRAYCIHHVKKALVELNGVKSVVQI